MGDRRCPAACLTLGAGHRPHASEIRASMFWGCVTYVQLRRLWIGLTVGVGQFWLGGLGALGPDLACATNASGPRSHPLRGHSQGWTCKLAEPWKYSFRFINLRFNPAAAPATTYANP